MVLSPAVPEEEGIYDTNTGRSHHTRASTGDATDASKQEVQPAKFLKQMWSQKCFQNCKGVLLILFYLVMCTVKLKVPL